MEKTSLTFETTDGLEIYATCWMKNDQENPKGIVHIAHGMAEHIDRYDRFAQKLVEENFIVVGNDHRGHGRTGARANQLGYFADSNGFEKVVGDMYALTKMMKVQHPNIPIILFGHSMGSFLARRYVQKYGEDIACLILSGTGSNPGILGKIGKFIAKREVKKHGATTASPKLNQLTFGSYNKKFKPKRTDFDWLTRDEAEVDKYIEDPLCGFICSARFFYDLLDGLLAIHRKENILNTPKELPIFLLAGEEDPVGNYGKGVKEVFELYKQVGVKEVSMKLYEGGRHEMLNEINRKEVMEDILQWLQSKI